MSSNYDPEGVYLTVKQRANELKQYAERAGAVELGLFVGPATGGYDRNAHEHAEERLLALADAVERWATAVRYMAGRYTVTGQYRHDQERNSRPIEDPQGV